MAKTSLDIPKFDPYALINKSQLRQGEKHSLTVHVRGLERALEHRTDAAIAAAKEQDVRVCLNTDMSALVFTFPGIIEHTVSWPLAERPDLIIEWLRTMLRDRRGAVNFIGTPGAPTKADLAALAKASKVKAKRPADDLTLEDLETETMNLEDIT